jgi:hypothetical protein
MRTDDLSRSEWVSIADVSLFGSYERPPDRYQPDAMNSQEWFIRRFSTTREIKLPQI